MNKRFVIRHVTRDEVLTHNGFVPRERKSSKGPVSDDKGAMEFGVEEDARQYLAAIGMQHANHVITLGEFIEEQELGVGQVSLQDFYGLRGEL